MEFPDNIISKIGEAGGRLRVMKTQKGSKMKRVLLITIVVFCLLVSATAGATDSRAWILWCYEYDTYEDQKMDSWTMIEAFPSYEDCVIQKKARVLEIQKISAVANSHGIKQGRFVYDIDVSNWQDGTTTIRSRSLEGKNEKDVFATHTIHYQCFPDTVDPRK